MACGDFQSHITTHALTNNDRLLDILLGAEPDQILSEAFDRIHLFRLVALTMPTQFSIQHTTFMGEILHLGCKMRAIPTKAMDEQERRLSCTCNFEGKLDAVTS